MRSYTILYILLRKLCTSRISSFRWKLESRRVSLLLDPGLRRDDICRASLILSVFDLDWESTMTERIWDKFLTERDRQVFAAAGYGAPQGFGKRPALAIIDVNYFFCGDRPEPILESIKRWRNSCGEDAWDGIKVIKRLLAAARGRGIPVIYTTGNARPDL